MVASAGDDCQDAGLSPARQLDWQEYQQHYATGGKGVLLLSEGMVKLIYSRVTSIIWLDHAARSSLLVGEASHFLEGCGCSRSGDRLETHRFPRLWE